MLLHPRIEEINPGQDHFFRLCLAHLNWHRKTHFVISRMVSSRELISSNFNYRYRFSNL
jgi:hypothetical protein